MALHVATEHGPLSTVTPSAATREKSRVALVTCAAFPDLEDDDRLLRSALVDLGVTADAVVWDAADVDWARYDLVLLRSPWDYPGRRDAFVAWAAGVPGLANPADIVAWNTDKEYLRELDDIPMVPTQWVPSGVDWQPPAAGEWVVKPTVSAGSRDTGRYRLPVEAALATTHVRRLQGEGRTAMIQPYAAAVDWAGETGLIFTTAGPGKPEFSHAIRKGAMLDGPDLGADVVYHPENITPRVPELAELALAERVLNAVPGGAERLHYARVDVVPGPDGAPVLMELELTEPTLFLSHAPDAASRLAAGILARLSARRAG